jgi:hypothetical protein
MTPQTTAEPIHGHLQHQTWRRARIRLEPPLADRSVLERLAKAVASVPGVKGVEIRPATRSMIIHCNGEFASVSRALADNRIIQISTEKAADIGDSIRSAFQYLSMANTAVGQVSGGRADLWSMAFAGLVVGGLVQLARGRIAGPALTLFGQAATLAVARGFGMPKQ